MGDAAFTVALGWRVTELTGKAGSLGCVLALESLATLASFSSAVSSPTATPGDG
jgi:hypothetical protein